MGIEVDAFRANGLGELDLAAGDGVGIDDHRIEERRTGRHEAIGLHTFEAS